MNRNNSNTRLQFDVKVFETQSYLNLTYSNNPNWVTLEEDGKTGWPTIRGLIRALQIELGVAVDGSFGPGTESKCPTLSKNLNPDDKTSRLVSILQGSMWCKGFSPGYSNGIFGDETEAGVIKFQSAAGLTGSNVNGVVTTMIFKALLNMDAFVLVSSGDPKIRQIQQELNRDYHKWIGLRPTDGRYGRDTCKALIYALQVEGGIAEPNGTFGPATQASLPTLAPGSKNAVYVRIMQYCLYCNTFDPTGFTGVFGNGTLAALKNFQAFHGLVADGYCGKQTWMSLLLSHGDRDRPGTACDCSQEVTAARAKTLVDNGYKIVGRYIVGGEWKKLKNHESKVIFDNGLRLFPIFQKSGNSSDYFNYMQGFEDGKDAVFAALKYGFPEGTTIYFAVDYDAMDGEVTSNILPYFRAVRSGLLVHNPRNYKIGVYGARNICSRVSDEGIATTSFVGDLASGFSGNLGYPLTKNWAFDQIKEDTIGSGDGEIDIDKNIASGRDNGVSYLTAASSDEVPYDKQGLLEYLIAYGILSDTNISEFGVKTLIGVPSINPYITVEGEVSFEESLKGPHQIIEFENPSSFTVSLIDSITQSGVEVESEIKLSNSITATIKSFKAFSTFGNVKYTAEVGVNNELIITLEQSKECPPRFGCSEAYAYLRYHITIYPNKYPTLGLLTIPVVVSDSSDVSSDASSNGWSLNNSDIVISIGIIAVLGSIYIGGSLVVASLMTKLAGMYMMLKNSLPNTIHEDTDE